MLLPKDRILLAPNPQWKVGFKSGTALNHFELDLPRLSVDIDLNYVGIPEREEMLAHHPQVEKAIKAVFFIGK